MALSTVHTNWAKGSYFADRNDLVKQEENKPLYALVTRGQQGTTYPLNCPSRPNGIQPYVDKLGSGRFSLAVERRKRCQEPLSDLTVVD